MLLGKELSSCKRIKLDQNPSHAKKKKKQNQMKNVTTEIFKNLGGTEHLRM